MNLAVRLCMSDPTRFILGDTEKRECIDQGFETSEATVVRAVPRLAVGPKRPGLDKRLDAAFSPD